MKYESKPELYTELMNLRAQLPEMLPLYLSDPKLIEWKDKILEIKKQMLANPH